MAIRVRRALLVLLVLLIAVPQPGRAEHLATPTLLPVVADNPAPVRGGAIVRTGALAGRTALHLVFDLTGRDPAGLQQTLHDLYDPHSAGYHRFLTARAYAARFGPDPSRAHALIAWLRSRGLQPGPWDGGTVLDVRGDAQHIQAALRVQLALYATPAPAHDVGARSRAFFAASGTPLLPAALAPTVRGIVGLSQDPTFAAPRSMHQLARQLLPIHRLLRGRPTPAGASGTARETTTPGYTPAQIAAAYDYAPIYAAGYHGEGIHIALVELAPFQASDIAAFVAKFGLPSPTINQIPIDSGNAGEDPNVEATLDIELLAGATPGAVIDIYNAPNDPGATGILDAYTQIANDGTAQVLSTSWVHCEPIAQSIPIYVDTQHALFQKMASEGISVVAATGDAGAYGCADQPPPPDANPLSTQVAVNTPASDPLVLAVGASDAAISSGPGGVSLSETAWSCSVAVCGEISGQGGGSGGGLSSIFKQGDKWKDDLSWQIGPGVHNAYSNGARQVPDVVFAGSVGTVQHEYAIIYQGHPEVANGTSAAAPMWAALIALADQYLLRRGATPLGWIDGIVYRLGASAQIYPPFHDITTGDNLLYQAGPGWDFASGWGSPDAWNFLRDLAAQSSGTPSPTVTPSPSATSTATVAATPPATRTPRATATAASVTHAPTATGTPAASCSRSGIANGDFSSGTLSCWQTGGSSRPVLNRTMHFKGRYSVRMGAAQAGKHTDSSLAQPFTIPTTLKRPALHVSYWLARSPSTAPARAAGCKGACPRTAEAALPTVTVRDAKGAIIAAQRLVPRRERTWSGIALTLPPVHGRLTLLIAVPPQPVGASLLLYVDQVRLS